MNDVVKCNWKSTPFSTPWVDRSGTRQQGWADEWIIGCEVTGTVRTEPRADWLRCPYCGKEINWLTDPNDPSLPHTVPTIVQ